MATFRIELATDELPTRLAPLVREADEAGIANVGRLVTRWLDGSQIFDGCGEQLLIALCDDLAIGVGGLTQCPDVPGALRVRRFFVADAWRRRGVATAIATRLIASGSAHTDILTCNAQASPTAPAFWEAMGFTAVDTPGLTHALRW